MGYRDERDGLTLRVEQLETELAAAKQEVARLRGEVPPETPPADGKNDWVLGRPLQFELARTLPFDVTDQGMEAIAELINQRLPGANVTQVGRTLTHRRPGTELRLSRTPAGHSRLRIAVDYKPQRTGILAASPGLALLGGVLGRGLFIALGLGPQWVGLGTVVSLLLTILGVRKLMLTSLRRQRRNLTGLFEAICDMATKHKHTPNKRVAMPVTSQARIAIEAGEEDIVAEREANAVEDAELATDAELTATENDDRARR